MQPLDDLRIDSVQTDRLYANTHCYTYADVLELGGESGHYLPITDYLKERNTSFAAEIELSLKNIGIRQTIFHNYNPLRSRGWMVNINNGELEIKLSQNDTSWQHLVSTGLGTALGANEWSHIVVQRNQLGIMEAFVNGINLPLTIASATATFKPTETVQPPSNTTGIYLGTDGQAMFIKGNMRQFRLYERVLTLSEIAANRASLCRTPVNSTGIVAYVPFSEGIGNVFELYRAVQTTRIRD